MLASQVLFWVGKTRVASLSLTGTILSCLWEIWVEAVDDCVSLCRIQVGIRLEKTSPVWRGGGCLGVEGSYDEEGGRDDDG